VSAILNKEAKRELVKFIKEALPRAQIPRSNVGQVTHVSLTPSVTSQEADITCRAPEAALAGVLEQQRCEP